MASSCLACPVQMDTLGIEPRAFRMRSGCDTTTPCALAASGCAICYCGCGSVCAAAGVGGARGAHAGYSSVGRASDCRRLQQSDGPWFDSGWPDSMRHALCGLRSLAHLGHSLAALLACPLRLPSALRAPLTGQRRHRESDPRRLGEGRLSQPARLSRGCVHSPVCVCRCLPFGVTSVVALAWKHLRRDSNPQSSD